MVKGNNSIKFVIALLISGAVLALHIATNIGEGTRFVLVYPIIVIGPFLLGFLPTVLAACISFLGVILVTYMRGELTHHVWKQITVITVFSIASFILSHRYRKAESVLVSSERRLKEAYQIARLSHWSHDFRTNKTWWSEGYHELFGIDKSVEASDDVFFSRIHPEDKEFFEKKYNDFLVHGNIEVSYRIIKESGEIAQILSYGTVTYDSTGKPMTIQGTNQDVTESQKKLLALNESQSHLAAIYSAAPGILFQIKIEAQNKFRFVTINPAFLTATGLQQEQVLGRYVEEVIPKESIDMVLQNYRKAIEKKCTVKWEEKSSYPTGVKIGEVAVTPLLNSAGEVTHLSGVVHDITERKRLEDDLKSAVASRDEFISVASHELKTPLAALHLQIQLCYEMMKGVSVSDDIINLNRKALGSIGTLNGLVNELLDVARIRAGKISLNFTEFDLTEAVIETSKQYTNMTVMSEKPVVGRWDAMRMSQVINNLLSNAHKYGEGKPVEITVKYVDKNHARLEIKDHGMGIPPEMHDKIFERFQRAVSGYKITGLGLGLYIVRQIVEAHGGTIHLVSEPQQGSTFTVVLPLYPQGQTSLQA